MNGCAIQAGTAFGEYVGLLIKLHGLIRGGQGDSAEAGAVRDKMDAPWKNLTVEEIRLIRGLSADLDSLGKAPSATGKTSSEYPFREFGGRLVEEYRWPEHFELLRRKPDLLPLEKQSYFRGVAWEDFGFPAIAKLFYEDACRLAPWNPMFKVKLALLNLQGGDSSAAIRLANELLDHSREAEGSSFGVLANGFALRAMHRSMTGGEEGRSLFTHAKLLYEAELSRRRPNDSGRQAAAVHVSLGMCMDKLGEVEAARHHYDRAIEICPDEADFYSARGIHHYDYAMNSSAAVSDFDRALQLEVESGYPIFYLAHDALMQGEYAQCREYAEEARLLIHDSDAQAQVNSWIAICLLETGGRREEIELWFQRALELAPDDPAIQSNYEIFRSGAWNLPEPERRPWDRSHVIAKAEFPLRNAA